MKETDTKFRTLVNKSYRHLHKRPSLLHEFQVFVSLVPASWKRKNILWNRNDLSNIMKATTFTEVFTILNQYWDWRHYELLEYVINEYGSASLKKEMKNYCKDMEKVASRIMLYDTKGVSFSSPCSDPVIVEVRVKGNPSQYNLTKERTLRQAIAQQFDMEPYTLHLSTGDSGSVILHYQIPLSLSSHMIVESKSKHHFFREQEVIELTISGICVYTAADETSNEDSTQELEVQVMLYPFMYTYMYKCTHVHTRTHTHMHTSHIVCMLRDTGCLMSQN